MSISPATIKKNQYEDPYKKIELSYPLCVLHLEISQQNTHTHTMQGEGEKQLHKPWTWK